MKYHHVTDDSSKFLKQFIDFPHELYKKDSNYVPALYVTVEEILNKRKNPFFQHSEAEYFLLKQGEKVVGRIAAILNNNYNAYHDCHIGFFGFFDCIDDQEVADQLLDLASDWLRKKGVNRVLGPANFTTNDTAGLLIEGFETPPVFEMTYNFPYYINLLENYGFTKEMDMYAYYIATDAVNKRALNLSFKIQERLRTKDIHFRTFNKKNFKEEVKQIKRVYRSAWEKNWGFIPPTDAEFDALAEGLKLIVDERYAYIAEHNGEVIGFGLGLPDLNEVLIDVKKGRLFPTGIFKLLLGRKKVKKIRIILLGVIEEYRNMGIEAVFFANFIRTAQENGLTAGEASWVLESNPQMVKAAEKLNGERYKTYRIYTKDL